MQSCCACLVASFLQAFLASSSAWAASLFDAVAPVDGAVVVDGALVSLTAAAVPAVCACATPRAPVIINAARVDRAWSFMGLSFLKVAPGKAGQAGEQARRPNRCRDVSDAS